MPVFTTPEAGFEFRNALMAAVWTGEPRQTGAELGPVSEEGVVHGLVHPTFGHDLSPEEADQAVIVDPSEQARRALTIVQNVLLASKPEDVARVHLLLHDATRSGWFGEHVDLGLLHALAKRRLSQLDAPAEMYAEWRTQEQRLRAALGFLDP
jgi:hypothetical protein